jgi:DNA repair protein RadC
MEDIERMSSRDLLVELIGEDSTNQVYSGSLLGLVNFGRPRSELRPLLIARELWERIVRQDLHAREVFASPSAVKNYLSLRFAGRHHEVFMVLFLDAHNRLIQAEEMFRGTLTQTAVYPREVVIRALEVHAASVILSHNHPSGFPTPSRADEALTGTLRAALELVGVQVLDHIVWAAGETTSFAERGLL